MLHRTTIIFVLTNIVLFLDGPQIGAIIFVLSATILLLDKPRITHTIKQYLDTGHNFIKQNSDEFDMKKYSSRTQVTPRNRSSRRTVTPPLQVENVEIMKLHLFNCCLDHVGSIKGDLKASSEEFWDTQAQNEMISPPCPLLSCGTLHLSGCTGMLMNFLWW